jgi:hypothetical protein
MWPPDPPERVELGTCGDSGEDGASRRCDGVVKPLAIRSRQFGGGVEHVHHQTCVANHVDSWAELCGGDSGAEDIRNDRSELLVIASEQRPRFHRQRLTQHSCRVMVRTDGPSVAHQVFEAA